MLIPLTTGVWEQGSTVSVVTRLRAEGTGFGNPSEARIYFLLYTSTPTVVVTLPPAECELGVTFLWKSAGECC